MLPGFGPSALVRDPDGALLKFKSFCCSQFGQRNCASFIFFDVLRDSGCRLVRATCCSAAASYYTSHARANGQHDRYAAIHAGDIVDLLCADGDWSFVRSYYHAVPHNGWPPQHTSAHNQHEQLCSGMKLIEVFKTILKIAHIILVVYEKKVAGKRMKKKNATAFFLTLYRLGEGTVMESICLQYNTIS